MPTFQSTLPARGATRWTRWTRRFLSISIHAPRTGSDADGCAQGDSARSISIHAPRTGSDGVIGHKRFSQIDFNPRSPHGERLYRSYYLLAHNQISIHAPRTGSDQTATAEQKHSSDFNPRSPHGERRERHRSSPNNNYISIHAPRTGSDATRFSRCRRGEAFQSTLPARGATSRQGNRREDEAFQSTLPARGATKWYRSIPEPRTISIHAPRTGSDHLHALHQEGGILISIHAPRTGSDRRASAPEGVFVHFNPRSPHGERLCCLCRWK